MSILFPLSVIWMLIGEWSILVTLSKETRNFDFVQSPEAATGGVL